MISDFVKSALQRTDAPDLLEEFQSAMEKEKAERRRFYDLLDENRKMEFINGEIVFQSPVKKRHNAATGLLYQLLNVFAAKNDLGFVGIEKILVSLTRNDYEPDVCFWLEKRARTFKEDQMKFPAPDFVAEFLSTSMEKTDRETKFEDYARHGVAEYWIVSPAKKTVEQYQLAEGRYELLFKADHGTVRSFVIEGFEIPVQAIFDKRLNLKALADILRA